MRPREVETDADVVAEKSLQLWDAGYYCAESVLLAVAEALHLSCEAIPRIATGLCSGLARTGGLCGALAGAMLAASAVLGRNSPEDSEDRCYDAIHRVTQAFTDRFGAQDCFTLAGCHLGTEAGQAQYRASGQRSRCGRYVYEATRLTMETLRSQP